MSTTGDLYNNIEKLRIALRHIDYKEQLDVRQLSTGHPSSFLPLLHYILLDQCPDFASYLARRGYNVTARQDARFLDGVYKISMAELDYKPRLTKAQFLTAHAFAEQKTIILCDLIRLVQGKRRELGLQKTNLGKKPGYLKQQRSVSNLENFSPHTTSQRQSPVQQPGPLGRDPLRHHPMHFEHQHTSFITEAGSEALPLPPLPYRSPSRSPSRATSPPKRMASSPSPRRRHSPSRSPQKRLPQEVVSRRTNGHPFTLRDLPTQEPSPQQLDDMQNRSPQRLDDMQNRSPQRPDEVQNRFHQRLDDMQNRDILLFLVKQVHSLTEQLHQVEALVRSTHRSTQRLLQAETTVLSPSKPKTKVIAPKETEKPTAERRQTRTEQKESRQTEEKELRLSLEGSSILEHHPTTDSLLQELEQKLKVTSDFLANQQ